ncbi:MAG TPA: Spy/CpxP family protein refolding chaperone [Longimicrobium sp.]
MVKRWILGLALCAGALAVPRTAAAQHPAGPAEAEFRQERVEGAHPAALLLANRRALSLTDAQVAGLEEIRARLRASNRELWALLAENAQRERASQDRPGANAASDREAWRAATFAADEARSRIRQNAQLATEEALALLTEAQRAQLPGLLGG